MANNKLREELSKIVGRVWHLSREWEIRRHEDYDSYYLQHTTKAVDQLLSLTQREVEKVVSDAALAHAYRDGYLRGLEEVK